MDDLFGLERLARVAGGVLDVYAEQRAEIETLKRQLDAAIDRIRDEFGGSEEEWREILLAESSPARIQHHPRTGVPNGPE